MKTEIITAAASHQAVFRQLFQFYLYDFSEMIDLSVDENGRFDELDYEALLAAESMHVFLLRAADEWAGMALVEDRTRALPPQEHINMDEFFVMRKFRRRGVGAWFATALFDRFAGRWRVSELSENPAAQAFWRRTIHDYTAGHYIEVLEPGRRSDIIVQYFETLPKA